MDFGRLMTAMVTPFNESLEVDLNKLDVLIEHLIQTGTTTIVVAGSTGESATLTHDETLMLFMHVTSRVAGRVKVIGGTGTNNTAETIAFSREAEQIGLDGLLLVSPYYNKPSQEGLYQHFKSIAESVKIPCILYNVPRRTSVNIEAETTLRLSQIPNIVGIKESSGDIARVSKITSEVKDGFYVYSGDDYLTLPMLSVGCYGVVSVASHVIGRELNAMIKAFVEGRLKDAIELHKKLTPVFNGVLTHGNPTFIKTALNLIGLDVGCLRPPLVVADERAVMEVKQLFSL